MSAGPAKSSGVQPPMQSTIFDIMHRRSDLSQIVVPPVMSYRQARNLSPIFVPYAMSVLRFISPNPTDGRREGWANWDEGAYKGESPGSIGTDVDTAEGFQ